MWQANSTGQYDNILAGLQAAPDVQEISYTTKLYEQWFIDTDNILEKFWTVSCC